MPPLTYTQFIKFRDLNDVSHYNSAAEMLTAFGTPDKVLDHSCQPEHETAIWHTPDHLVTCQRHKETKDWLTNSIMYYPTHLIDAFIEIIKEYR